MAMSESYPKVPGMVSEPRRLRRLSSAASSSSGSPATTPRDLRSASLVAHPSRASSPPGSGARQSRLPRAIWSPEPDLSRQKPGASSDPIASSGTRKRRRCRAGRPIPPPPARPNHARLCGNRSAASRRTPGPPRRTRSPRRPHRRQHPLQRRGVDADGHAHRRARDRHFDPFRRTRYDAGRIDHAGSRIDAVVETELDELQPLVRHEPRLAPPDVEQPPADAVAPRHLGYVHLRLGTLGQDPRLLLIAPVAPTTAPRDHLDPLITVGIMPGLMHGMNAPRDVEPRVSLAQPNAASEVGLSYRLQKFSCRDCGKISQSPAPFHCIPRAWAGPSLLAMLVFEKFGQHQPLNRQAERYALEGAPIALSTMADAVGAVCSALDPLRRLVEAHVMAAERMHGNDTTVPVLALGKAEI